MRWIGTIPTTCDLCKQEIVSTTFIDGKVRGGPWAIMDEICWANFGSGIGPGVGQRYNRETGEKVDG